MSQIDRLFKKNFRYLDLEKEENVEISNLIRHNSYLKRTSIYFIDDYDLVCTTTRKKLVKDGITSCIFETIFYKVHKIKEEYDLASIKNKFPIKSSSYFSYEDHQRLFALPIFKGNIGYSICSLDEVVPMLSEKYTFLLFNLNLLGK